jgi:hypothetical protein
MGQNKRGVIWEEKMLKWWLKAGMVEQEQIFIAEQRIGNQISVTANRNERVAAR